MPPMRVQLKSPNQNSFWDLTGVPEALKCLKPGFHSDPWVVWSGRHWLCKRKEETVCEIAGYQIAEALDLPLQPWVAFFQKEAGQKRESFRGIGILVERWPQWKSEGHDLALWAPAKTHPEVVGRALALGVLDRHEWPRWLIHENELRLIDLERIGPFVHWPPHRTPLRDYGTFTQSVLDYTYEKASSAGLLEHFEAGLQILTRLDFPNVLDFTGLPCGDSIRGVILRGLEARQRRLRRLLD